MKQLTVLAILGFAMSTLADTSSKVIGNVVAEERSFDVSVEACTRVFKLGPYSSSCAFSDASLNPQMFEQKVGGTKGFTLTTQLGGRDREITVSFETTPGGWYMVFSKTSDASASGLSLAEATTYMHNVIQKVQGKANVIVYTVK